MKQLSSSELDKLSKADLAAMVKMEGNMRRNEEKYIGYVQE